MTDKRTTQPLPIVLTASTTEPIPPPSRKDDTDPMTMPPVVVAGSDQRKNDTVPDMMPPPAAVAHAEAESFLQQFLRPPRPPAPEPEQGASSDGRAFVAHYANNARPAARMRTADPPPGVHVLEQLAELANAPSSDLLVAQRDLPITVPGRATARRRILWSLGAACVAVGLIGFALLAWNASPTAPAASATVATATASSPIPSPSTAPSPSIAQIATSTPSSIASVTPTATAASVPPATTAPPPRPESPKPARPAASGANRFMSEEP